MCTQQSKHQTQQHSKRLAKQKQKRKQKRKGKDKGRKSRLMKSLYRLLYLHNRYRSNGVQLASFSTQRNRSSILIQATLLIYTLFKIDDVHAVGKRHIEWLVEQWLAQGLSPGVIQNRFSILNTFCKWIGKNGMAGRLSDYVDDARLVTRHLVTNVDKSWSGQGVDIRAKLDEIYAIDERVGKMLEVMWAFGLRAAEAWQFHPRTNVHGAYIAVRFGPKNGKARIVDVETDDQRRLLEELIPLVNRTTGSLIPDAYSKIQWKHHFYRVCRQCGIARDLALTPHGLRHEYANYIYHKMTGRPSPVRSKDQIENSVEVDPETDQWARVEISNRLGHSRTSIVGAYIGSPQGKQKCVDHVCEDETEEEVEPSPSET